MDVARLYYEKDRTQNEIAEIYRISRPMVSKLLKEAKEEGIVKITIAAPGEAEGPGQEIHGWTVSRIALESRAGPWWKTVPMI